MSLYLILALSRTVIMLKNGLIPSSNRSRKIYRIVIAMSQRTVKENYEIIEERQHVVFIGHLTSIIKTNVGLYACISLLPRDIWQTPPWTGFSSVFLWRRHITVLAETIEYSLKLADQLCVPCIEKFLVWNFYVPMQYTHSSEQKVKYKKYVVLFQI